ncbi:hypothetical protein [Candidatus Avelusimicrobium stercoris]|uniref:hypothetical protein n=1 Tax=Candidatus Avelusimicrobium stercoris TaxID=1947924 RepID=UPI003D1219A4
MNEVKTCPHCHNAVDEKDNYCRFCGRSLKPGRGFFYSHSGIILAALVLGPFALPLVWLSKIISTPAKWIYTLLLLLLGVYLAVALYHIFLLMQDATQLLLNGGLPTL